MTDWKNRIVGLNKVPVNQLHAHELNARRHPAPQREALRGSLDALGIVSPPIRNIRSNTILDGHARVEEYLTRDENMEIHVLDVDLAEHEEALFLASFDYITGLAAYDRDALDTLLKDVQTDDTRLQAMLSEMAEANDLYFGDAPEAADDPGAQVDRADALAEQYGTALGQVWQLGRHRLIIGDCTDRAVVDQLMQGEKPQMMVTDPPYGVEYEADWRNDAFGDSNRATGTVTNDDNDDWTEAWKLSGVDVVYCWHAIPRASSVQNSLEVAGFEIRTQIIWNKTYFVVGRGHYHVRHEPCWYAVRKGANAKWIGDSNEQTIWNIGLDERAEGGHSTQKPLECMAHPIRNHDCAIVYDPFLGSGTTLIACEQLNRICYGCEIHPPYAAVIIQRWETTTGQKAVCVSSDH